MNHVHRGAIDIIVKGLVVKRSYFSTVECSSDNHCSIQQPIIVSNTANFLCSLLQKPFNHVWNYNITMQQWNSYWIASYVICVPFFMVILINSGLAMISCMYLVCLAFTSLRLFELISMATSTMVAYEDNDYHSPENFFFWSLCVTTGPHRQTNINDWSNALNTTLCMQAKSGIPMNRVLADINLLCIHLM